MTSRRERFLAVAGALLLLAGAFLIIRSHGPMRDTRIAGAAVRVLEPTHLPAAGTAVVFHGLASNRVFMQQVGQWLAAQGLRVYLVDAPGHGATPGSFTHTATLDSSIRVLTELQRGGKQSGGLHASLEPFSVKVEPGLRSSGLQVEPVPLNPQRTIIVGHSMGGEIGIRLADYFPVAATIAFAPAPMVLPRRMPANLLVIGAQFDFPQMRASAQELLHAAGGSRTSLEDFRERRAANGIVVPWTAHGSVVLDSRAAKAMAEWARAALGLTGPPETPRGEPLTGEFLGIAGICLLFPLTTTWIVRIFRANSAGEKTPVPLSLAALLAYWSVAALLALSIVSFWYPQRLFPFYGGGYLACFLLLAGIALALLFRKHLHGAFDRGYRPALAASALGLLVFFGLAAWLNWQLTDVWMSGARWLYFVPLFLANLPYVMAEEMALGPPEGSRHARRFGTFLGLRLVLFLALLAGIFIFLSGQVLMGLLAAYFVAVSLGQRFGADALRRRTGSAAAAAIFSAILVAWFMAAVFPLS
jgi:pimeloyl-ACP methyl ester carboxylesterase